MSVIVKGMKMPKYPTAIRIQVEADGSVYQNSDKTGNGWALQKNVTATEVPPHGRLIDADARKEQWLNAEKTIGAEKVLNLPLECFISYGCVYDLDNAPTIIEAEGT